MKNLLCSENCIEARIRFQSNPGLLPNPSLDLNLDVHVHVHTCLPNAELDAGFGVAVKSSWPIRCE